MQDYKYKVSVIVPVYNPGVYLRDCLDSLVGQTVDKEDMEVILIDDGSTDNSLAVCQSYAEVFSFFHVYTKENSGVGATRNYGMDRAQGKYLLFLDSDDVLTPETVKETTDFFDTVYDEVDLVTYKIVPYRGGKALPGDYRYNFVKKSGVYTLESIPFFAQTNMNIVIKNGTMRFADYLIHSEDQLFITDSIMEKEKIGFCEKGEYRYTRNDESTAGSKSYAYYMFEQKMPIFEHFLQKYNASRYVQGIIMRNFRWMLTSDCIFPYHYEGEKWEESKERLRKVVDQIDPEIILSMPEMDNFHKHFWLAQKRNISPTVICEEEGVSVFIGEKEIYSRKGMEIVISKVTAENDIGYIVGFIKSPVFNYIKQKPNLIGILNEKEYNIPIFDSINSCYHSTAKTNLFWGFGFEFKLAIQNRVSFLVELDGIRYKTHFYLTDTSAFNTKLGIKTIERNGYSISYKDNGFLYHKKNILSDTNSMNEHVNKISAEVSLIRSTVKRLVNENHEIWIYCDSQAIGTDNGYLQFIHDWEMDDGIERYYVYMGDVEDVIDSFSTEQRNHLIPYGSQLHKILFLAAKYVICSFIDLKPRLPFKNNAEYAYYRDMDQPEIVYIGHGVLHADLTYLMSAERCKAEKIVVSTYMEKEVLLREYHYREKELLPVGAPRYDFINPDTVPQNRILYAPSWRKYLAARYSGSNMTDFNIMKKSEYFAEMMAFLQSEELHRLLAENDLYMDVKLHQNAKLIMDDLEFDNDRIVFTTDKVAVENYKIFITDISSFVFDFVYLKRPVLYFVPDLDKIKSGMHSYRKLHIPLEEGFGALTLKAEDATKELEKIIRNDYLAEEIYRTRMEHVFLPLNNCREKLYNILLDSDSDTISGIQ